MEIQADIHHQRLILKDMPSPFMTGSLKMS